MRNLRLEIEYDGANFSGWQVQNSPGHRKRTIQDQIEKALQKILQEKIRLIGSGRTDAGVHAWAQIANFKTNSSIPAKKMQSALNAVLPSDIAIKAVAEVRLDFHSRFSARSKIYRYTILNRPFRSSLLKGRVYFFSRPLDVALMRREARSLLGRHDFRSFCASGSGCRDTTRRIRRISIKRAGDLIVVDIEADGFLYNMVRNIVGTLLEIGRGKFQRGSLKKILRSRNRRLAGPTAPAEGLCLLKVDY